jgi:hypothetical protein
MRLIERPTWAQLIEKIIQGKDKNEIAHEGSGTTDIKSTRGDAAPLSDQQQSDGVHVSNAYGGSNSHYDKCVARSRHPREAT